MKIKQLINHNFASSFVMLSYDAILLLCNVNICHLQKLGNWTDSQVKLDTLDKCTLHQVGMDYLLYYASVFCNILFRSIDCMLCSTTVLWSHFVYNQW